MWERSVQLGTKMSCLDNIYSLLKSTQQLAETKASSMCLKARLKFKKDWKKKLKYQPAASLYVMATIPTGEFSGFYTTSDSKSQKQKTQRHLGQGLVLAERQLHI